jgi:hypothetical protein
MICEEEIQINALELLKKKYCVIDSLCIRVTFFPCYTVGLFYISKIHLGWIDSQEPAR